MTHLRAPLSRVRWDIVPSFRSSPTGSYAALTHFEAFKDVSVIERQLLCPTVAKDWPCSCPLNVSEKTIRVLPAITSFCNFSTACTSLEVT